MTELLRSMRKETNISEPYLEKLLTDGKYEEAAQCLCDAMPDGQFEECLSNRFDKSILQGYIRLCEIFTYLL